MGHVGAVSSGLVRCGLSREEADRRQAEEEEESEELSVESAPDKTLPFYVKKVHNDIFYQVQVL